MYMCLICEYGHHMGAGTSTKPFSMKEPTSETTAARLDRFHRNLPPKRLWGSLSVTCNYKLRLEEHVPNLLTLCKAFGF